MSRGRSAGDCKNICIGLSEWGVLWVYCRKSPLRTGNISYCGLASVDWAKNKPMEYKVCQNCPNYDFEAWHQNPIRKFINNTN